MVEVVLTHNGDGAASDLGISSEEQSLGVSPYTPVSHEYHSNSECITSIGCVPKSYVAATGLHRKIDMKPVLEHQSTLILPRMKEVYLNVAQIRKTR